MTMKLVDGVLTPLTPAEQAAYDAAQANPPVVVPMRVTLTQARIQLRHAGLFDAVDAYIEANKVEDPAAWEAWNHANDTYRDSPLVNSLAQLLGVSSDQMDALFIAAQSIEV